jgi:outer membrane receptor for ferrienterochelin and colicins
MPYRRLSSLAIAPEGATWAQERSMRSPRLFGIGANRRAARRFSEVVVLQITVLLGFAASAFVPHPAHAQTSPRASETTSPPPEDILELPTVVVTGTRTERPASRSPVAVDVITRKAIERSGAEDLAELLEESAGVQVARTFRGAGVRLMGFDEKHVLVLVDGVRAVGRTDGVLDLARYTAENIERVEIVRGPASALYGSEALGGVIHVITRKSDTPLQADFSGAYGSVGTGDVSGHLGASGTLGRIALSAGWHRAAAFRIDPSSVATSGSAFDTFQAQTRGELRPTAAFSLGARLAYWQRRSHGVDIGAGSATYDRRNTTETLEATLSPTWRLGANTILKATLGYSLFRDQFLYDQRGADAQDQFQETHEQLAQATLQLEHTLRTSLIATFGAEVLDERLTTERLQGGAGARQRLAPYAQLEWRVARWLEVVPGLRADFDSQFGNSVSPKLNLRLDPAPQVVIRASGGLGFRAPSFKELLLQFSNPSAGYLIRGNPALRPETSMGFLLSAEARPNSQATFSLTLFRNDLDNLIFPSTTGAAGPGAPTQYRYENIARAHTQGLELTARLTLPRGLSLDLGYSLWASEDEERHRALEGRPLHRGTLALRYALGRYGFDALMRCAIVGSRPFYEDPDGDGVDATRHAAPYVQLDLRVSKRLGRHLSIFAGADNLTNAGDARYLPLSPRGIYAGAQGRF